MRLGCCIDSSFLPDILPSGYDFAELQCKTTMPESSADVWRENRDKLLGYGVPIEAFNVLLPRDMAVVGPNVEIEPMQAYLERVFERMADLGGKHVSFGSGGARTVPDGFDWDRADEQLKSFISMLGQFGEKNGITVNIEFLNRKETNTIVTLESAADYAARVNHPSIKILADFYHLDEEQAPVETMEKVAEWIGYVHVADTGRFYPGSGQYPYDDFFRTLRKIGYDGPVSVECRFGDTREEMKLAAAFLRKYL